VNSGEQLRSDVFKGNQWIPEREKDHRQLARLVSLYQSAVEALDEGLLLYDGTGVMVQANSKVEKLVGLTAAQISGMTPRDPSWRVIRPDGSPFPGEERPALTALREGVAQRGVVMGIYDPAGKLKWISVNAVPFGSGDDRGVVETAVEVPPPGRS
jgi:PAS domain S-box-containing protein